MTQHGGPGRRSAPHRRTTQDSTTDVLVTLAVVAALALVLLLACSTSTIVGPDHSPGPTIVDIPPTGGWTTRYVY